MSKEKTKSAAKWQEGWLSLYARNATNPISWQLSAMRLKRAADLIYDYLRPGLDALVSDEPKNQDTVDLMGRTELIGIYFLLIGLAFENLLKGTLLSKHTDWVTKNGWQGRGHHNLDKLCDEAGVHLSTDQRNLVEELTAYVKWAGRYPIYRSAADLFPDNANEGEVLTAITVDQEPIDRLFTYIDAQLDPIRREIPL